MYCLYIQDNNYQNVGKVSLPQYYTQIKSNIDIDIGLPINGISQSCCCWFELFK